VGLSKEGSGISTGLQQGSGSNELPGDELGPGGQAASAAADGILEVSARGLPGGSKELGEYGATQRSRRKRGAPGANFNKAATLPDQDQAQAPVSPRRLRDKTNNNRIDYATMHALADLQYAFNTGVFPPLSSWTSTNIQG
jgi:hypothetical protein